MADPAYLGALERAEKAATPGPWTSVSRAGHPYTIIFSSDGKRIARTYSRRFQDSERAESDGALIAIARGALPGLVAELRALQERRCETCESQRQDKFGRGPYCDRLSGTDGVHCVVMQMPCAALGNTCGKWTPRAEGK